MHVRTAGEDELPAAMGVLDAAMLEVDVEAVRGRLAGGRGVDGDVESGNDGGDVLVAVEEGRVLGACVLESDGVPAAEAGFGGAHVEAIAVRPGRRGLGVGTALVEAAAHRYGALTADFDARVRPFYESLGFEVEPVDGDRSRGYRPADG